VSQNSRDAVSTQIPNADQHALIVKLHRSLCQAVTALITALTLPIERGRAAATALRVQELVAELGDALDLLSGLPAGSPSQVMTLPAYQVVPGDRLIADLSVSEVFARHPLVRHVSTVGGLTTVHHADGQLALGSYEPLLIERGPAGDPEPAAPAAAPEPEPADACAAPDTDPEPATPDEVHSAHLRTLLAETELPDAETPPDYPLPHFSTGDWFARADTELAVAR
jgi:hypothetical protein